MSKSVSIKIALALLVLAIGILIGRWLLPNKEPCTVDYLIAANCVIALGTIALVIVGGLAAKFAYQTAQNAIDALNVKTAPFILAEVDTGEEPPTFTYAIRLHENKSLLLGPPDKDSKNGARISIRNLGERAVFDVQVIVRVADINGLYESTTAKIYAQWLLPDQSVVYLIQNDVSTTVLKASIERGSVGSESQPGQSRDVHVYESGTFPIPIA